MTVIEQRRHNRFALKRQPVGEFRLQTPAASYPIDVIKDISSSGIRVYLDTSLTLHLQVAVEYMEPGFKVEVNGMVVWCSEREPDEDTADGLYRFVVGIQLLSPVMLMAMSGSY